MEILKSGGAASRVLSLGILLALSGSSCTTNSVTETIPLDTDTYISSADSGNHSELDHLNISKAPSLEERIITKLPTSNHTPVQIVDDTLNDLLVFLFFFPLDIIADLLSCESQIVQPQNLTSAELVFDVDTNSQGTLDGTIQMLLLGKPWFQSVNWTRAHPFSSRGLWSAPGGDTEAGFAPVQAVTVPQTSTSIEFDITSYFKNLINANGQAIHYGFLLEGTGAALAPVTLFSTQYASEASRPRLVSIYTGSCVDNETSMLRRRTTILGAHPRVIDEVLAPASSQ